jgi:hypothetical protein
LRPLTALALVAFATLSWCEDGSRQADRLERFDAERVDRWREHITIVPYVDAGVTCFVLSSYNESLSCVRTEAAR